MPSLADAIKASAQSRQTKSQGTSQPAASRQPDISSPDANSETDQKMLWGGGVQSDAQPAAAPEAEKAKPDQRLPAEVDDLDGLTEGEQKALAVLTDPANRSASVKDMAKKLGMAPANFRRIRNRPRFQKAIAQAVAGQAKAAAPQVVQACIESALVPGREGFQDRKLLMQLAGILDDKGRPDGATADALKGMTSIADRLSQALSRANSARQQPGDDAQVIDHEPG